MMIEQTTPTQTWTTSALNWIDLMERALEQRAPAPAVDPGAPAEPELTPAAEAEEEQPAMKLLRFLESYEHEHGQMPGYNEIAKFLQFKSAGHARYCVVALEKAGLVHLEPHVHRSIRITPYGREVLADAAA